MRLPISAANEAESIEFIRYGPNENDISGFSPRRWIADFEAAPTRDGSRLVNIAKSSALDLDVSIKGVASVVFPRHISRQTRFRGWKRLEVSQTEVSAGALAAWLIWPKDRSRDEQPSILIHPEPDPARFMADLPDKTPWQDLSIAGTHDSAAFHGFLYAQCQQPATSVTRQLYDGVRSLDLRMRVIDHELIMYHGTQSQRATFVSVLDEVHLFLSTHPSESLLISLKEEVPPNVPRFSRLVWEALSPHVEKYWFLETRLPTLGEVRGRAMIIPRFSIQSSPGIWDKGVGLNLDSWPNDVPEGWDIKCGEEEIRVQDWYGVPSVFKIPEKLEAATHRLDPTITGSALYPSPTTLASGQHPLPAPQPSPNKRPLTISYLSGATALAPPSFLAKGVGWPWLGLGIEGLNSRFTLWMLELMCVGKRFRGVVPLDFYLDEGEIAKLSMAMNQMGMDESLEIEDRRVFGEKSVGQSRKV